MQNRNVTYILTGFKTRRQTNWDLGPMLFKFSGEVPKFFMHFIYLEVCNISEFLPCAEIILFILHNTSGINITPIL